MTSFLHTSFKYEYEMIRLANCLIIMESFGSKLRVSVKYSSLPISDCIIIDFKQKNIILEFSKYFELKKKNKLIALLSLLFIFYVL